MDKHNQVIFLIEDIQPSWLPSGILRWVYSLGQGLVLGVINSITVLLAVFGFAQHIPFDNLLLSNLVGIFLIDIPVGLLLGVLQGLIYESAEKQGKPGVSTDRQRWLRSIALGLLATPFFLLGLLLWGVDFGTAIFVSGWSGAFYIIGTQNMGTTYRNVIDTVEALSWSWRGALQGLVPGVMIGLVFTLLTAFDEPEVFWYAWLIWTSPWTLAFFLTGGLQGRRVEKTTRPNQGIRLSARNAIFMGGLIGMVLGVFFWLFQEPYNTGTLFAVLIGIMTFFSLAMTHGISIVGHYWIRLLLSLSEQVPLALTEILDYAAGLVLLRKVGGGYIFTHRILLKHFSSKDGD